MKTYACARVDVRRFYTKVFVRVCVCLCVRVYIGIGRRRARSVSCVDISEQMINCGQTCHDDFSSMLFLDPHDTRYRLRLPWWAPEDVYAHSLIHHHIVVNACKSRRDSSLSRMHAAAYHACMQPITHARKQTRKCMQQTGKDRCLQHTCTHTRTHAAQGSRCVRGVYQFLRR